MRFAGREKRGGSSSESAQCTYEVGLGCDIVVARWRVGLDPGTSCFAPILPPCSSIVPGFGGSTCFTAFRYTYFHFHHDRPFSPKKRCLIGSTTAGFLLGIFFFFFKAMLTRPPSRRHNCVTVVKHANVGRQLGLLMFGCRVESWYMNNCRV